MIFMAFIWEGGPWKSFDSQIWIFIHKDITQCACTHPLSLTYMHRHCQVLSNFFSNSLPYCVTPLTLQTFAFSTPLPHWGGPHFLKLEHMFKVVIGCSHFGVFFSPNAVCFLSLHPSLIPFLLPFPENKNMMRNLLLSAVLLSFGPQCATWNISQQTESTSPAVKEKQTPRQRWIYVYSL